LELFSTFLELFSTLLIFSTFLDFFNISGPFFKPFFNLFEGGRYASQIIF